MKRILMLATVVLLLALGAGTALAQSGYDLFQKALVKERAVGDVEEALRLYQRIIKEFSGNHALAAKAQLRMGLLYDRLGRKAEAQRAYQVVVSQYADRANEARQARAKIVTVAPQPRNINATAKTATGLTARQIWAGNGANRYASVSPDGRYMSYVRVGVGLASELFVRDLITGTIRRLTSKAERDSGKSDDQDAEYSVISPDSRQVAYTWVTWVKGSRPEGRPDLRVRPATEGQADQPRIVYRGDEGSHLKVFDWTPDGRSLLVVRKLMDDTWQIGFISVADGSVRVLKSLEWREPIKASLSPDGRYIAYDAPAGERGSERDIFMLAADGSRETPVEHNPANDRSPVWSPDGSRIVFLSDRTGNESLWMVPLAGGGPTGPAELVKTDIGTINPLGMTRSGALYYVSSSTITNVYIAEMDAKLNAAAAPSLASDRWINSNHAPVWSPDGQHLAYYSQRPPVVRIRSMKTGEDRALPTKIYMNGPVRWFPDGHSVLTTSRDPRTGQAGYYRVDTESGDAELLHRIKGLTAYTMFPDLSSDGRTIFYVDCAMNCNGATFQLKLMRFDIDSRRETELRRASEPGARTIHSLAVSPDGAQLAYLRGGGNGTLLEVMPAGGGEPREVFRYKAVSPIVGLAWTPDQRYLLFVRPDSDKNWGTQLLWRVPVTGGEPENMGISMHMIRYPRVHPDGRRIAFDAAIRPSPELWALENFLPATPTKKTTAIRRH